MIELITVLIDRGHAYTVDGITFFDVSTHSRFGSLSGYDEETMIQLAAERGGRPDDPRQRNPLDFVLWQPSLDDEPVWDSPFGPGRPGWHIECSTMVMGLLGHTIDLHGGGTDLIFPHHECELAQSESATGVPFVRHWMHTAMVGYRGEKMSKSVGNLVFVSELAKEADPRAIRLALMGHHYRTDWEWFDSHIQAGVDLLDQLHSAAHRSNGPDPTSYAAQLRAALDNDLDAPRARDTLQQLASAILAGGPDDSAPSVLVELSALCGIDLTRPPTPLG
jgi:L-cysteine:1D-myo-inositol 2-amino-2-deoxy-alpha-D-glucopyranoside ligase